MEEIAMEKVLYFSFGNKGAGKAEPASNDRTFLAVLFHNLQFAGGFERSDA